MDEVEKKGSMLPLIFLGVSALAYLLSTLILFLAALVETFKEESYGHGWSGGKSVTDLHKWHLLESNGPGKTILIICFVLITIYFAVATIHNIYVAIKGVADADRPLTLKVPLIAFCVIVGILAIVGIAMLPYDFLSGKSYSENTQCYGSYGCYSYGQGNKSEINMFWALCLILFWGGELLFSTFSFFGMKADNG